MSFPKLIAIATTPLLLALCTACAQESMMESNADLAFAGEDSDTEHTDTGADTDEIPLIEADTWSIDANLILIDGAIDPEASTFSATFWGDESDLCTTTLTVDNDRDGAADTGGVIQADPTDSTSELFGQWNLHFEQDKFCSQQFPAEIILGIGTLDDQLIPSVISAGLGPDTLNGLYIQQQNSDTALYVFGAIGTQEQFDGLAGPLTDAPIPDGDYIAQTLYLLPLIAN
jgi:hypothetical protein